MLNVTDTAKFDESITKDQYRHLAPYNLTSLGPSDEIRIAINQQDVYTLPWRSSLLLEGRFEKIKNSTTGATSSAKLSNNAFAFLFDEIRYELGGASCDSSRNVGLASTIITYLTSDDSEAKHLSMSGWGEPIIDSDGNFEAIIPLNRILGLFMDFRRIILNTKQELVLIRARNDADMVEGGAATDNIKIHLHKIFWRMPFIEVATQPRLELLNVVQQNAGLSIPFRSWQLYEYPELPQTTKHSWTVKTSSQLETPRFIIVGFQTDRRNNFTKSASEFDHCKIRSLKLYLNAEAYPYENLSVDFSKNAYGLVYDMYAKFATSFFSRSKSRPLLNMADFKTKAPLFVIDCSKQNEQMKSSPVDMRLELETHERIPAKTAMLCMIVHDSVLQYFPLTNIVKKM